ncbi:MAG: DUF4363 family protein [Clostridia bacterium]|nr:DUF4363 family protein [Clostridia bacterium]
MKATIWTLVVILVLLSLIGWGGAWLTRNASKSFYQEAEMLEEQLLKGDWAGLKQRMEALEPRWLAARNWLQLWINHKDTDDVTLSLGRLRAGMLLQDASLTMDAIAELKEACLHLYHRDALRLTNLI